MTWKRISYAIIWAAALAAYLVSDSGAALYVFVCLSGLPLLSLLLLCCARGRVKFEGDVRSSCIRGGALQITVKTGVAPRFLCGEAKVIADIENTTFGKTEKRSFLFRDLSFTPYTYDYVSADSGRICVYFRSVKLYDLIGLFSFTVKVNKFAEAVVSPVLYDGISMRMDRNKSSSVFGETVLPKKGNDVSEVFNVRDYVAGDSLNAVHWKLSGKFGTLKSKEFGCTDENRILILVDLSRKKSKTAATDRQLNTVLDVAVTVSDSLIRQGYAHSVGWVEEGVFGCTEVSNGESSVDMVSKLMSMKVSAENTEGLFFLSRSAEFTAFTKLIIVSALLEEVEVRKYHNLDITAVSVSNRDGEIEDGTLKFINVTCENVYGTLSACVL